jgi:hypothetical protein
MRGIGRGGAVGVAGVLGQLSFERGNLRGLLRDDGEQLDDHLAPALDESLLETHFARDSAHPDWDRIHVLINLLDTGFPRLIREYNQPFRLGYPQRLAEPDARLAILRFAP